MKGVSPKAPKPVRAIRSDRLSRRTILAALLGVLLCCVLPRTSPAQVSPEYRLKAVLLWRLAQFVEWPANAFADAESPLVIGVLGENPFGEALEVAVRGETANGRKIMVQHFRRIQDVQSCHVLFVSNSEAARAQEIVRALVGRHILTTSDIEDFARSAGGMVQFAAEEKKIRLRINLERARSAGLVLDARLLRMADVISTKPAE